MKKLSFVAAFAAVLFSFNACAPEDPATAVNVDNTFKTTRLEGYVYLDNPTNTVIDNTTGSVVAVAPEGTVLSFTIAYSDLGVTGATGNYVTTYTLKSNDGKYEVELPVREDGIPVTVSIQAQTLQQTVNSIKAGQGVVTTVKLYDLNTTASISKGLAKTQNVTFSYTDDLSEDANWEDATYKVILRYTASTATLETTAVPTGTPVVLTIAKNKFSPARDNDFTYVTTVGASGSLEIKLPAPSFLYIPAGLGFNLKSSFVAESSSKKYIFNLDKNQTLYGGKTVSGDTLTYTRGAQTNIE